MVYVEEFSEVVRSILRQHYRGEIDASAATSRIAGHLRRHDRTGAYVRVPTIAERRRDGDGQIVVGR